MNLKHEAKIQVVDITDAIVPCESMIIIIIITKFLIEFYENY